MALAEEERLQIEQDKLVAEENLRRQEEVKRLRLEEETLLKMEEDKRKKKSFLKERRNFMQPVSEAPKLKQVWQRIKKHGPNVTHTPLLTFFFETSFILYLIK